MFLKVIRLWAIVWTGAEQVLLPWPQTFASVHAEAGIAEKKTDSRSPRGVEPTTPREFVRDLVLGILLRMRRAMRITCAQALHPLMTNFRICFHSETNWSCMPAGASASHAGRWGERTAAGRTRERLLPRFAKEPVRDRIGLDTVIDFARKSHAEWASQMVQR